MSTSALEKGYGAIASDAEAKPTKSWRRTLVALAAASVVVVGATAAYSARTAKTSTVTTLAEETPDQKVWCFIKKYSEGKSSTDRAEVQNMKDLAEESDHEALKAVVAAWTTVVDLGIDITSNMAETWLQMIFNSGYDCPDN